MAKHLKKGEKAAGGLWGPACSLALLGVIGAFFWLGILLPTVGAPREDAPPGLRLQYTPGDARSDGQWQLAVRRIAHGNQESGTARLTAGDINALARTVVDFDGASRGEGSRVEFYPAGFNVKPGEEETQVVVLLRTSLGGKHRDVHLLVRGVWQSRQGSPVLAVRQSYLNSARLPAPVGGMFFRRVMSQMAAAGSDSLPLQAWGRLKEVRAGDGWLDLVW